MNLHEIIKYYILFNITALIFSQSGITYASESAWELNQGSGYCVLVTSVNLYKHNNETIKSIPLVVYYINSPNISNGTFGGSTKNRLTTVVSPPSLYTNFKEGTHALLQSKSLLNELVSLSKTEQIYKANSFYELDYHVHTLFIDALLNNEKILLTLHLESQGEMTGLIATEGFDSAYKEMESCIDVTQS